MTINDRFVLTLPFVVRWASDVDQPEAVTSADR